MSGAKHSHQELFESLSKTQRFTWNFILATLLLIDSFVTTSASNPTNIGYASLTFLGSFGFLEYQRNIDDLKESAWKIIFTYFFSTLGIVFVCCWLVYLPVMTVTSEFDNVTRKITSDIISLWIFGSLVTVVFMILFYKMIYPVIKSLISEIVSEIQAIFNGSKKFRKNIFVILIIELCYALIIIFGAKSAVQMAELIMNNYFIT